MQGRRGVAKGRRQRDEHLSGWLPKKRVFSFLLCDLGVADEPSLGQSD